MSAGAITPVKGYQFAGKVYPTLAEAEKAARLHKAEIDLQDATDRLGEEMQALYERNAFGPNTLSHFVGMAGDLFPFSGTGKGQGFFEAFARAQAASDALAKARGQ